jgi:hypothetical protein
VVPLGSRRGLCPRPRFPSWLGDASLSSRVGPCPRPSPLVGLTTYRVLRVLPEMYWSGSLVWLCRPPVHRNESAAEDPAAPTSSTQRRSGSTPTFRSSSQQWPGGGPLVTVLCCSLRSPD